MENPIKMDDLGLPLFLETPVSTASDGEISSASVRSISFHRQVAGKGDLAARTRLLGGSHQRWLAMGNQCILHSLNYAQEDVFSI